MKTSYFSEKGRKFFIQKKQLNQNIMKKLNTILTVCIFLFSISCNGKTKETNLSNKKMEQFENNPIIIGALNKEAYYPLLEGKRIAILSNNSGLVDENTHILDQLLSDSLDVVTIFSPEHGFRGNADAGEHVKSSFDEKTGIPISSLYEGKGYKPSKESMDKFDVLVFDIQDVGLRFYTYYITMARLMEAAAENGKEFIVLDRPNPNGFYVDGPILDMKYKSGVGYLPIPVVHGMTLGELALMINGENWLPNGLQANLTVVPMGNYTHQTLYDIPVAPSPNLRTMQSIYLYPSICLFEGTPFSLGRGTNFPFEVYGHPEMKNADFEFTPRSVVGAKNPPLLDKLCYGRDLRNKPLDEIFTEGFNLSYVIDAYNNSPLGDEFFTPFFEKLVGVDYIRKMIKDGKTNEEIRKMWENDVDNFKKQRKPYLLYEE